MVLFNLLSSWRLNNYHCQELWFTYCSTCTLTFSPLKFENGLRKQLWHIAEIKYGFVKLVVIFLLFTRCDYVIPSLILNFLQRLLKDYVFISFKGVWKRILIRKFLLILICNNSIIENAVITNQNQKKSFLFSTDLSVLLFFPSFIRP